MCVVGHSSTEPSEARTAHARPCVPLVPYGYTFMVFTSNECGDNFPLHGAEVLGMVSEKFVETNGVDQNVPLLQVERHC